MNTRKLEKMVMAIDTAMKEERENQKEYLVRAEMFDCVTFRKLAGMKEEYIKILQDYRTRVLERAGRLIEEEERQKNVPDPQTG